LVERRQFSDSVKIDRWVICVGVVPVASQLHY